MRSYSEMTQLESFIERYRYLKLPGVVGVETFGFDRWLNQRFYKSYEWQKTRSYVIARDLGFDLGVEGHPIQGNVLVHHINPVSKSDIEHGVFDLIDPENLVSVSLKTHNAIHFGDENQLPGIYIPRQPGDTTLW